VSELVEIAGGEDIFAEQSHAQAAAGRIVRDGGIVLAKAPEIIVASWCGKKFRPERLAARPGWQALPAVRAGELHEIKSSEILQPGPAALTDGVRRLHSIFAAFVSK